MDIYELRPGNYVNIKVVGKPTRIFIIDKDYEHLYEPVQLTEEWLKEFGLYKPYDQFYWTFNDSELSNFKLQFTEDKLTWYVTWDGGTIKYRQYVHELQNLLFELARVKL